MTIKIIFLTFLAGIIMISTATSQDRPQKKVLEFCHVTEFEDILYPEVVLAHIKEMQKQPFDGLIFRLKNYNHMSDIRPWSRAELKPQFDALTKIEWGRLTNNFLYLYINDNWDMDWFNDDHWKNITNNMMLISEAAKAGKFAGICLDVEPYGETPFQYPGPRNKFASKPFAEVAAKARQRGMQFINALQTSMPEMDLLQFFQLAVFDPIIDIVDPQERENLLNIPTSTTSRYQFLHPLGRENAPNPPTEDFVANSTYYVPWHTNLSLMYPFFLGMLEAAGPGITFIDGNEDSYYYENPEQFYRAYHTIRNRALGLIPSELRTKYNKQVQVGTAIYMNQMMGYYKGPAINFSPDDRLRFFEHNLYYALQTSDKYVWIYTDLPLTWWYDFLPGQTGQPFPEGTDVAMHSAIMKYIQGKPLGFNLTKEIAALKEDIQIKNN